MSRRHSSSRRRNYGRRQHEVRERRTPSPERLEWDGRANGADPRVVDFEDDAHTQGLGDSIAGGQP